MATPLEFEVYGSNNDALFNLKVSRGEGMALLGMNWKIGPPPVNFAGFAIEYREPNGTEFFAIQNRITFGANIGNPHPNIKSSRLSPFQKFRWVHFPFHPGLKGNYTYRVTPVFMDDHGALTYGDHQDADIQLENETYPGAVNIAFTRGFTASQAFEDRFSDGNKTHRLLPGRKDAPLYFVSENPQAPDAYAWMGLEARQIILDLLDAAIADAGAHVVATAYDLDLKEIVDRLEKLGTRLRIIIDDSDNAKGHGRSDSDETKAAERLAISAGEANVQRQKAGGLQHNKYIAVSGSVQQAIGGSTNFSWRGFFVQNNNAILVHGQDQVNLFFAAFQNLWDSKDQLGTFTSSASATWHDLKIPGIPGKIAFSPHADNNACLDGLAADINTTTSSLMFSLAFLYQTEGAIKNAIVNITNTDGMFVYGISDKDVDHLDLQAMDGNPPVAVPSALAGNAVIGFKGERSLGSGIRMHHKFVVIDFDKPTARVYTGSYNFSVAADLKNAENLWMFQNRRIAVAYAIEAVSMFDHYEWRDALAKSAETGVKINLKTPPKNGEKPWWEEDYTNKQKARDRELFSQ